MISLKLSLQKKMIRYKQSRSKKVNFKPARNALIDFYLDGFGRRETNTERPCLVFVNYLTIICYIISIIKHLICFMSLSRTTKLILFDAGVIFGGIEIYSRLFYLCGMAMGLAFNIIFRFTKGSAYREWTFVFETARHRSLMGTNGERNVLAKIVKVMRLLYKFIHINLTNFSK